MACLCARLSACELGRIRKPQACRLLHFERWLDFCTWNSSGPGTFALR
jgi:hypothetical protein